MDWVTRIFTVGLEMVLPGLGGDWLDHRLGTGHWFTLAGFGLGMVGGMWHLILMTQAENRPKPQQDKPRQVQPSQKDSGLNDSSRKPNDSTGKK